MKVDKTERKEYERALQRGLQEIGRELTLVEELQTLPQGASRDTIAALVVKLGDDLLGDLVRDKDRCIDRSYVTIDSFVMRHARAGEIDSREGIEPVRRMHYIAGSGRPLLTPELRGQLHDVRCLRRLLGGTLTVGSTDSAAAHELGMHVTSFYETCLAYWQQI